jgi:hypothetical protein
MVEAATHTSTLRGAGYVSRLTWANHVSGSTLHFLQKQMMLLDSHTHTHTRL